MGGVTREMAQKGCGTFVGGCNSISIPSSLYIAIADSGVCRACLVNRGELLDWPVTTHETHKERFAVGFCSRLVVWCGFFCSWIILGVIFIFCGRRYFCLDGPFRAFLSFSWHGALHRISRVGSVRVVA